MIDRSRTWILIAIAVIVAVIAAVFFIVPRGLVSGKTLAESNSPQIAFIAYGGAGLGDVFVYDEAVRAHIQITRTNNHVSWASWSPDGRYLAFFHDPDGETGHALYRYDVTNGENLRLTPQANAECFQPAWSPDGRYLACSNAYAAQPGVGDVFLVRADGSGVTPLTQGSRPSWSTDSSKLIFVTGRDPNDINPETDIASMDIAGGEVTFLAELKGVEYKPQWSPDGRLIAYVENHYHSQGGLQSQTLKLWDGEKVTVVAEDLWTGASEFDFSPDGQILRFLDCRYDIQSAEGTCGGTDSEIVYSRDGSMWAVLRNEQICLAPMGLFEVGCIDVPQGNAVLLGWRP